MATVDLTIEEITTSIRAFLLAVLPTGTPVVLGQVNRVPPPKADGYVVMTPLLRGRLSLNTVTWDTANPEPADLQYLSPGEMTIQCDMFGALAADWAAVAETLWRSAWGCEKLEEYGDMAPLYANPARQTPLVDGQQQYEDRWSVDLVLQVNQRVTMDQDFANALEAGVISVDATYPPAL